MLKAFVPEYDEATKSNARVARHVFTNSHNVISGQNATRASLQAMIASSSTTSVILMSHGDMNYVCGQNGDKAISTSDIACDLSNVLRLKVFAWACNTSLGVGAAFQRAVPAGGSWWGYRTTISAPDARELSGFIEVLQYIADHFHGVQDELEAGRFFEGLFEVCFRHRSAVVKKMARRKVYKGAQETAVAFREICEKLDVWLPSLNRPIQGPQLPTIVQDL